MRRLSKMSVHWSKQANKLCVQKNALGERTFSGYKAHMYVGVRNSLEMLFRFLFIYLFIY